MGPPKALVTGMIRRGAFLFALASLSGGCIPVVVPGETVTTARIVRSDGVDIGKVEIIDEAAGSRMHFDVAGLPPGVHGVHVHSVGRCDRPSFASAGPHWNPTNRQHGHQNPAGFHAGDMGNVTVDAAGRLVADVLLPGARIRPNGPGPGVLMAGPDGASLVIHAAPDDERTDPSGNSGDRIACAVLAVRPAS
jgi:Cu-Zn family superoxide dismutase